jgi:CRP/FNR family transcriptional regulator
MRGGQTACDQNAASTGWINGMAATPHGQQGALLTGATLQTLRTAGDCGASLPCGACPVRAHAVCNAVPSAELNRLAALATTLHVARGQTFVREGAPAEHFSILVQGSAKLYKRLPDGRNQIIGFGYAGSILGLTVSKGYVFSAEAIEPVWMCRLSQRLLCELFLEFPALQGRLLEVAASQLAQAHDHMLLLGRKSAAERFASFLHFQTTRRQPRNVVWPRIRLPMSRSEIADYLGLTVETVSRCCAALRRHGVIAIPNVHEIVILDLGRLEALARG